MNTSEQKLKSIIGCILGTAVGDALGLPCEALSKRRQAKLFPSLDGYHFFFKKGMVSDDTEHTCFVASAIIASAGDEKLFRQHLSWKLRLWLLCLPGGIGFATLRAILKLLIGFASDRSGVFSAGNGPAMRSAILGVYFGHNPVKLQALVKASTRITHTDPKAEFGAMAVAWAAYLSSQNQNVTPEFFRESLYEILSESDAYEFKALINRVVKSIESGQSTQEFAESCGLDKGVTGYIYDTVPVAIHAWLRHQNNFHAGITEVIRCGGDTDTTAAIVGAIIGASVGAEGIPNHLKENLLEWPCSLNWMERLGKQLFEVIETGKSQSPLSINPFSIFVRNLFFISVIAMHVVRRLFPPF